MPLRRIYTFFYLFFCCPAIKKRTFFGRLPIYRLQTTCYQIILIWKHRLNEDTPPPQPLSKKALFFCKWRKFTRKLCNKNFVLFLFCLKFDILVQFWFFIHTLKFVWIFLLVRNNICKKKSGSFSPKIGGGNCQNLFQAI